MSDNTFYAGIDIGGTNIKYGIFNHKGNVVFSDKKPTMAQKGKQPLINMLKNIGEILLVYASEEDLHIDNIGVGSPGVVDYKSGNVIGPCPNIPDWVNIELRDILNDHLNVPVFVDNDVNSMALAEAVFGAARGYQSVICATVGTGIGGGVIIDGKVFHGFNSAAGELGHMTINFDGPKCACGNRGCIESYCSSKYILDVTKVMLNNNMTVVFKEILDGDISSLTIKKLFQAANQDDEIALEVIDKTAYYLGVGLAGIVNLLNPETVIIGGGITDGGAGFVEKIERYIKEFAFTSAMEKLKVKKAELGNNAGFIGAGLLGEYNQ